MAFKKFLDEFKEFIAKGSAIDMAIGIIVGGVMTGLVNSLVKDIIMPPIGLLIGGVDFSNLFIVISGGPDNIFMYKTIAQAHAAGATTINIGVFLNAVVSFAIVMLAVFMIVRVVNKMRGMVKPPITRECPYCKTQINKLATKCQNCCSVIK